MKKILSRVIILVTSWTLLLMGCPIVANAASINTTFSGKKGTANYSADEYITEKHVTVWLYKDNSAFTTETKTKTNCMSVSVSKSSAKAEKAYGIGYELNYQGSVVAYEKDWSD